MPNIDVWRGWGALTCEDGVCRILIRGGEEGVCQGGFPHTGRGMYMFYSLGLSAAGAKRWLYVRLVHALSPCHYSMASLERAAASVVPVQAEVPVHTL